MFGISNSFNFRKVGFNGIFDNGGYILVWIKKYILDLFVR